MQDLVKDTSHYGGMIYGSGSENTRESVVGFEDYDRAMELQKKQDFDEALYNNDPKRVLIGKIIHSKTFKTFMALCVFSSIVIVIHETDQKASKEPVADWANRALGALLAIYIIELVLRLYVSGHKFFWAGLNIVDMSLVFIEITTLVFAQFLPNLPNVMVIRIFRLIRIARFSSVLLRFRPLYLILQGFFSAMQAIFYATVLVFIVLSLWSIVSVEFLHPIAEELIADGTFTVDCGRCTYAFSTVMQSNLTFLQTMIVADSWATLVMPIIEKDWRCAIIFVGVFITVQLGMLNLILAVIVDSAAQAREEDEQRLLHEKKSAFKSAQIRFHRICTQLDTNKSGTLTQEELIDGLHHLPELSKILHCMDISEAEVSVLFRMMDSDRSGDVSYAEFTEMLHRFKHDDLRTHIMFLKHYVLEMTEKLDNELAAALRKQSIGKSMRELPDKEKASVGSDCRQEATQNEAQKPGISAEAFAPHEEPHIDTETQPSKTAETSTGGKTFVAAETLSMIPVWQTEAEVPPSQALSPPWLTTAGDSVSVHHEEVNQGSAGTLGNLVEHPVEQHVDCVESSNALDRNKSSASSTDAQDQPLGLVERNQTHSPSNAATDDQPQEPCERMEWPDAPKKQTGPSLTTTDHQREFTSEIVLKL